MTMRVDVGEDGWCLGHTRNCKKIIFAMPARTGHFTSFHCSTETDQREELGEDLSVYLYHARRPNISTSDFFQKQSEIWLCVKSPDFYILIQLFILFYCALCRPNDSSLQVGSGLRTTILCKLWFSPEVSTMIWSSWWPGGCNSRACHGAGKEVNTRRIQLKAGCKEKREQLTSGSAQL